MPPELFNELKYVNGFTKSNGKTYIEHICIIFSKILSEDQKKILMKMTEKKALEYLKTVVDYTMTYSIPPL